MSRSRWSILTALALLTACARSTPEPTADRPAPLTVPGTDTFVMHPRAGNQAYRISVGLPASYDQDTDRRYPVVYMLDADVGIASAVEITRFLAFAHELPEVMVVGIGYGQGLARWSELRTADLTPVAVADQPSSGHADRFLAFITGEVIPLIESRYRAAGDRTLFGYSSSGLFGTYVLFHRPGLFQRYVLGSPSMGWADRAAFQWPAAIGRNGPPPTGVVFTTFATKESPAYIESNRTFWDAVDSLGVNGLQVIRAEIDETHAGGWPHTLVKGMKAVFAARPAEGGAPRH